jgi:hypothetical protein
MTGKGSDEMFYKVRLKDLYDDNFKCVKCGSTTMYEDIGYCCNDFGEEYEPINGALDDVFLCSGCEEPYQVTTGEI